MQRARTYKDHPKLEDCGFLENGHLEVWWEGGGNSIQTLPKEPQERKAYLKNLLQRGGYDPEKLDGRVVELTNIYQRLTNPAPSNPEPPSTTSQPSPPK